MTRLSSLCLFVLAPGLVGVAWASDASTPEPEAWADAQRHCAELVLSVTDFGQAPFRYGRHTGQDAGGHGLLDLLLCRRRHTGEDGGRHARLDLRNALLDNRRLQAEIGNQGRYRLRLEWQRLAAPASHGVTVFGTPGSPDLRLPANWQPGTTTALLPALQDPLQPINLGVERRRGLIGLVTRLGEHWQIDSRYTEHRRSGLRSFAGLIGNSGGNPRVTMLPEPVDQRSREVELALRHAGTRLQLRLWLLFAQFDNRHDALRWDNPYAAISGWHPSAGHPDGRGQASLMPDNRFSQVGLWLAHALSPSIRLNADLALGRMRQNQDLLAYTINPVLAQSIEVPLPRGSLNGRIDTRLLQLRLGGRPNRQWHWQLAYRFDERDNRTPREAWIGIGGDSQLQEASATSSRLRYNLPVGHREQRLSADAGWRSARKHHVRLGIERREIDRTWSARAASDETRVHAGVGARLGEHVQLALNGLHSDRGGGTYLGSRPFLDSHSPAYTDGVAGQFENLPGLRQYHLADRQRQQLRASLRLEPGTDWQMGLSHGHSRDRYRRSEFGLQSARITDTMLDLGYAPDGPWSANAFLARERLAFDQAARAFSGGAVRLEQAADANRNWVASHRDHVDSAGFGVRRAFADGRWQIGIDGARSDARGTVLVRTGPALTSAPLPDSQARLHTIDLDARWRIDRNNIVQLRYRIEDFHGSDFRTDGVGPDQLANVILIGEALSDYRARALLLSWRRHW